MFMDLEKVYDIVRRRGRVELFRIFMNMKLKNVCLGAGG